VVDAVLRRGRVVARERSADRDHEYADRAVQATATVPLTATALDSDGTVTQVQFSQYHDAARHGDGPIQPVHLEGCPAGHTRDRRSDRHNLLTTTSNAVTVVVNSPGVGKAVVRDDGRVDRGIVAAVRPVWQQAYLIANDPARACPARCGDPAAPSQWICSV